MTEKLKREMKQKLEKPRVDKLSSVTRFRLFASYKVRDSAQIVDKEADVILSW